MDFSTLVNIVFAMMIGFGGCYLWMMYTANKRRIQTMKQIFGWVSKTVKQN